MPSPTPLSTPPNVIAVIDDDDALRDSLVWLLESVGAHPPRLRQR